MHTVVFFWLLGGVEGGCSIHIFSLLILLVLVFIVFVVHVFGFKYNYYETYHFYLTFINKYIL